MPTYSFRCPRCNRAIDQFIPLREYLDNPPAFACCGTFMDRVITFAPALAAIGERHYDGLRATDGTDISTRAKHRAYMREHNLTTVDDFTDTWKREARARAERLDAVDPQRKTDLAQAITTLEG